jgi:hypothetical protein
MDCEQTFADYAGTNRAELILMMDNGGVREGDTLCLRAQNDLGQGAAIKRHLDRLAEMGVTVEIMAVKKEKKVMGRPKRFKPTPDDVEYLCSLWYSPAEQAHVLKRASARMGFDVQRDKLNYICGPRDVSRKPKANKESSDGSA